MTPLRCVCVVWRLVPYHDARFNAAGQMLDLHVLEILDQSDILPWSDKHQRLFATSSMGFSGDGRFSSVEMSRLCLELDRLSPQVVAIQGWSDAAAFTVADWALRNKRAIVLLSESNRTDHDRRGWSESVKRQIVSACDAALVGGQLHADYLVDLGMLGERIRFGYNAIDNAHFERPHGWEWPSRPYFIVCSRLVENKNVDTILRAYARYRETAQNRPWNLVVLGSGPLRARLEALAAQLGIPADVRFEGFRKYHELPAFYHGAGALVHAATWEPWGLVVNEAMAAGLPSIVSATTGAASTLLRDGVNGHSFEPLDVDRLASLMASVSGDPARAKAMGEAGKATVGEWGPQRFAVGLQEACAVALSAPRRTSYTARTILSIMSSGHIATVLANILDRRAQMQNRCV